MIELPHIPIDDLECMAMYPKHKWVYELTRLLDSQRIKWEFIDTPGYTRQKNFNIYSASGDYVDSGSIYVAPSNAMPVLTETFIHRGDIKIQRHLDSLFNVTDSQVMGDASLRLNAFVSIHFNRFSGIITTETYGNEIRRVYLRPLSRISTDITTFEAQLLKKIY